MQVKVRDLANAGRFTVYARTGEVGVPNIIVDDARFGAIELKNARLGDLTAPGDLAELRSWGPFADIAGLVDVDGSLSKLLALSRLSGDIVVGAHLSQAVAKVAAPGSSLLVGGLLGLFEVRRDSTVDVRGGRHPSAARPR